MWLMLVFCCWLRRLFAADSNSSCWLLLVVDHFDIDGCVLHSHSGIVRGRVASFVFGLVLHLKIRGKEGRNRGSCWVWVCKSDCALC